VVSNVKKAVNWTDTTGNIQIFLVQNESPVENQYSLYVVGGENYKIYYLSKEEDTKPIVREIIPKSDLYKKRIQEFEFNHTFSASTIWMSIAFEKDEQYVPKLTRTFYKSIDNVVPNEQYLKI